MKRSIPLLLVLFGWLLGLSNTQEAAPLSLLSAYFGLDNALPLGVVGLCREGACQDGMPVILPMTIMPQTLQDSDFEVQTESVVVSTPVCAILDPAVDAGELRTVLLMGEFGSADYCPGRFL